MDSINVFKGYGKVNALEDPTPNKNKLTRKPLIILAISSILLLTVLIGALVGALIHESNTESEESESFESNSAESLRAVCSVTQYPDSCFTSLSSINDKAGPSKPDPELIFNVSLGVAIDELASLSSLPQTLISKSNDPRTESALRDCASLFGDALSQLNRSASSMCMGSTEMMMSEKEMMMGEKKMMMTESKINDMKTWISGAMSYQETCLDGLEEMGSTVHDEVRTKVQNSKEYMSNSLAILANMNTLLQKFDLTMH